MARQIFDRTIKLIIVIWIMSILVFFCIRIMPGDPVAIMFGDKAVSKETLEHVRRMYHLDVPIYEQYFLFMKDILKGNFGYSYFYIGKSVIDVIKKGLIVTCTLAIVAFPIAAIAGIIFGIISAWRMGGKIDRFLNFCVSFFTALPDVPFGVFLVMIFGVKMKIFPIAGWGDVKHMILPVFFISIWPALNLSKLVRSLLISEKDKPYVFMCRTRGMNMINILFKECIPNIMIPLTTKLGMMFGRMLEGALIAEMMFHLRGLARCSIEAINRRDYPVIMITVLLPTLIYTVINYAVEVIQIYADPRIRESEKIE